MSCPAEVNASTSLTFRRLLFRLDAVIAAAQGGLHDSFAKESQLTAYDYKVSRMTDSGHLSSSQLLRMKKGIMGLERSRSFLVMYGTRASQNRA